MRKYKSWNRIRTSSTSTARHRSFDVFLKRELPDSRRIVRDLIRERSAIDLRSYRLDLVDRHSEKGSQAGSKTT